MSTPATAMQEALWWVHQRARDRSVYHLTWRLACDTAPDPDALAVAWQAVVDRHDALRTAVVRRDETVELVAEPALTAGLERITVEEPVPGDLARRIAEELHQRPIDLGRAPLARLTLVRAGATSEIVLTVHHVVCDGWAMQLLAGDLSIAYAAALAGAEAKFADEPRSLLAYAAEQHAAAADGRRDASLVHWRQRLDGAVASTVVPDRPGPLTPGDPGAILRYAFSPEAAAGLAALGRTTFATPFAVLLAAIRTVLGRGGAGPDVSVGVIVANRMTVAEQSLVGYTTNLGIARGTLDDADPFADVVGRARDEMWQMLAHQALPYPAVHAALSETTRSALGDTAPVMVSYLGPIGGDLALGDIGLTLLPSPNRAARAAVAMSAWEADGGFRAEIEYNTGRFDAGTIMNLLYDIDAVLADGGADPARSVGSLTVQTRARSGWTAPEPAGAGPLPGTARWSGVADAWAELLGTPPSGPDADFFAAGGNSLRAVQLADRLRNRYDTDVDLVAWLAEPTARRLVTLLGEPVTGTGTATTLVRLRAGDGPHLHLVHGAGGGPHDYLDLLAALPDDWPVTASAEIGPLDSVTAMARRYQADLDAAGLRPDVLGGWSLGGQIAYEMAAGRPGPALVVLDSQPPVGRAALAGAAYVEAFARALYRSFDADAVLPAAVSADAVPATLAACLGVAGADVPAALLADRWRTYLRHTAAVAAHIRETRLPGPALVVGADLDDDQLGRWAARLPAARLVKLATDHYGVLRPDAAAEIARAIQELVSTAGVHRDQGDN